MDPLRPVIEALHAEGRLRVWSLVITVFGDSVSVRGGRIATARLRALLGRIGVEDGALRTALSRLAADGWVSSRREGRTSTYRLTPHGEAQTVSAAATIYAPPVAAPVTRWSVFTAPIADRAIQLAPGLWIAPSGAPLPDDCGFRLTAQIDAISDESRDRIMPDAQRAAIRALLHDIDALESCDLSPLDAIAARTLVLHRWRRVVLRWPEIPAELLPRDLGTVTPRARVADLYRKLCPAAEAWLGSADDGLEPMPPLTGQAQTRFLLPQAS
jgi:phenylacetic acid degradation operon negative regulatory protein